MTTTDEQRGAPPGSGEVAGASPGHRGPTWLRRVLAFYVDGFRSMDVGRTLWIVVLLKVAVLVLIATLLLPSLRKHPPANEREQTEQVLDRLTQEVSK